MKSILEIYSKLNEAVIQDARFMKEIFETEVYWPAKPQLTVVDLGAYTGEFCFYCLPFAKRLYAVEPDPRLFGELEKYIKEFELVEKISTHQLAIGRKNEIRPFHASGYGGGTFYGNRDIEVKALTLNTFFKENNIEHVDILKIDVEGAESEIFNTDDSGEAMSKVDFMIGELHGAGHEEIKRHGFKLKVDYPGGVFTASR